MKKLPILLLLVFTASTAVFAQAPREASIARLDPALDAIIAPHARLQMLKEDAFGHTEGPVWVREGQSGYLLFSDIAANVIYKWTPDKQATVFLKDSGYTGDVNKASFEGFLDPARSGPLYVFEFGSNGTTLDPQGRLVFCAQGDRAIIRIEKDGKRTVVADRFEGKRLNRPNDLVVKSDGAVYFTDPRPGYPNPTIELPYPAVFMVKDGQVKLLAKDLVTPNGIAFSPDEKTLYINDTLRELILRYDVQADGTIANGRVFTRMTDKTPDMATLLTGAPDGMKVDRQGNVYCTGPGGIWIMAPDGKHLGTIRTSSPVTNFAFGDADYKTLYITGIRNLLKIRLNTAGIAPGPARAL
jgi:gluconolactonase